MFIHCMMNNHDRVNLVPKKQRAANLGYIMLKKWLHECIIDHKLFVPASNRATKSSGGHNWAVSSGNHGHIVLLRRRKLNRRYIIAWYSKHRGEKTFKKVYYQVCNNYNLLMFFFLVVCRISNHQLHRQHIVSVAARSSHYRFRPVYRQWQKNSQKRARHSCGSSLTTRRCLEVTTQTSSRSYSTNREYKSLELIFHHLYTELFHKDCCSSDLRGCSAKDCSVWTHIYRD